jgi:hypothetical protein
MVAGVPLKSGLSQHFISGSGAAEKTHRFLSSAWAVGIWNIFYLVVTISKPLQSILSF